MSSYEEGLKSLKKLLKNAHTVDELIDELGVHRRTVYRWIRLLDEDGVDVVSSIDRPTAYVIRKSS